MLIYNFQLGGDQKISDWGNKKMINVPIKIETEDDNNLESSTSISAKTDTSHPNNLSNGQDNLINGKVEY